MFRFFKNKNNTKLYLIKDRVDKKYHLCPICDSFLDHSGNELNCSKCGFSNGMIRLTPKEAKKHERKILVSY